MRHALLASTLAIAACGGPPSEAPVDAGASTDAAPRADAPPGLVITAPERTWTWIPFPETRCMNDTPAGIGVNLVPGADRVFLYLEGGGACFNTFTCSSVAHQNGFGAGDLASFAADYGVRGVFNRDDPDNPFHDASFVFVPYCTGDVHAGNNPSGLGGRMMVGYVNFGLYLERLVPTFAGVSQVVLSGSSAGGFGAAWNFDRTQRAFGDIPVVVLDDSGPPLGDTYLTPCLQDQLRATWNLDATLPPDCAACQDGGLVNLATYLAETWPQRRFGLISSLADGTIRLFYGFGYPSCAAPQVPMPAQPFTDGLNQLADEILAPYDNFRVYYLNGQLHVWLLDDPLGTVVVSGTKLTDWIRGLIDGDPAWGNVRP